MKGTIEEVREEAES